MIKTLFGEEKLCFMETTRTYFDRYKIHV